MSVSQRPIAVLLMAMGGPDSLENVEPFLLDVRGGRPTPPELVEEIRERYRATGGKSPAVEITKDVAKKLEQRLNEAGGERYRVYVGLRHWHPFIKETYAELLGDAPEQIIGLCLAPQQSSLSTGAYRKKVEEARSALAKYLPGELRRQLASTSRTDRGNRREYQRSIAEVPCRRAVDGAGALYGS